MDSKAVTNEVKDSSRQSAEAERAEQRHARDVGGDTAGYAYGYAIPYAPTCRATREQETADPDRAGSART